MEFWWIPARTLVYKFMRAAEKTPCSLFAGNTGFPRVLPCWPYTLLWLRAILSTRDYLQRTWSGRYFFCVAIICSYRKIFAPACAIAWLAIDRFSAPWSLLPCSPEDTPCRSRLQYHGPEYHLQEEELRIRSFADARYALHTYIHHVSDSACCVVGGRCTDARPSLKTETVIYLP